MCSAAFHEKLPERGIHLKSSSLCGLQSITGDGIEGGIPVDKIRNLSVRKTIILYMAVSLVLTFLVSAFIVRSAGKIQERIWWKYVDEEQYFEVMEEETGRYIVCFTEIN